MSYLISDAITRSRQIIQDLDTPYRHSDEKLIGYFNDALNDAHRLRPDLFLGDLQQPVITYTTLDLSTVFPMDQTYFTTVIDFISGTVGLEDDEYAQDGRAQALSQRFIKKLTGKFA